MDAETINLQRLETKPCIKEDWKRTLEILEETQLARWFSGKEKSEDFYVVKEPTNKEIICCFTFTQKDGIGILHNFAVPKKYQRRGIGTYIVDNIVPVIAKSLGIKRLYLHGNDRGAFTSIHFWKKTIYQHIKSNEVEDQYYKDYLNHLIENYPSELLLKEAVFYIDLD